MLDIYSKSKAIIIDNLTILENVSTSEHIKKTACSLYTKLKTNIFSILVVGQFKRGKTTFINALLGVDLLPTAIIPLTSIITILSYGEKLQITSFFKNGDKKEIKLEDLQFYVTEIYNPQNKKGVDYVEIIYPSSYLKNGVQIIDTPGVASVYEHNTKTTYEYLPRADAAIFLMSVDPPITQTELYFLRDLKNLVVKTFFIQNKIDIVSESERRESLNFNKEIIEKEIGFKDVKIYPVSAKKALEGKLENDLIKIEKSGLTYFEDSLEQFLTNEKGRVLLNSVIRKMGNLIDEETLLTELEEKSMRLSLEELENKIEKFKTFISDINQEKIDSEILLETEVKTLQKETLEKDLEKLKYEKTKWLVEKVEQFALEHKTKGNREFSNLINEFIDIQIKNIFNTWRIEEEKVLKIQIDRIINRFIERMNKILKQIFHSTSEIFGVSYREFRIQETLPKEVEFRFQTTEEANILSTTLDLVKRTLPKIFAHKLILKDAREKIEMLLDRHCGKTRYDFFQRMEKLVRNYRISITNIVESVQNDILNALEIGITTKQGTTIEVETKEINIREKINILKKLQKSFILLNNNLNK